MQGELRRRPVGPGTVAAEGGDGDDDEGRVSRSQSSHVDPLVDHEDVGPPHEVHEVPVVADRTLRLVQELEQASGTRPSQGIAVGLLDLHDVGTGVGEKLGAVRPCDLRRAVDDPDTVQHVAGDGSNGFARRYRARHQKRWTCPNEP